MKTLVAGLSACFKIYNEKGEVLICFATRNVNNSREAIKLRGLEHVTNSDIYKLDRYRLDQMLIFAVFCVSALNVILPKMGK